MRAYPSSEIFDSSNFFFVADWRSSSAFFRRSASASFSAQNCHEPLRSRFDTLGDDGAPLSPSLAADLIAADDSDDDDDEGDNDGGVEPDLLSSEPSARETTVLIGEPDADADFCSEPLALILGAGDDETTFDDDDFDNNGVDRTTLGVVVGVVAGAGRLGVVVSAAPTTKPQTHLPLTSQRLSRGHFFEIVVVIGAVF